MGCHGVDKYSQPYYNNIYHSVIFKRINNMDSVSSNSFGFLLRKLRLKKGLSIKKLSSDLNINYTYISKLENNKSIPSEDFIKKVSDTFGYDQEELMLRAGKIPDDILSILRENPKAAVEFLRNKFAE